jgi:hypothetical protein
MKHMTSGIARVVFCGIVLASLAAPRRADAQDAGSWSLIEENDGMFSHQDRHYTQGFRVNYVTPPLADGSFWDRSFDVIGAALPMYRSDASSRRELEVQALGQSIFTPGDIHKSPPDANDRPYAGWLYSGLDWLQENAHEGGGHSLHNLELQLGVTGPAALAKQAQNGFHTVFGFRSADGWSAQLKNRVAVQASYDYKRRLRLGPGGRYGFDAVPEAGLSLGTVLRYVDAGALLRFGDALAADYGPEHIRPAPSGTAYVDRGALGPGNFHFYVYLGVQERYTFYNRLIDSADEIQPTGLERSDWVRDYVGGLRVFLPWRLRVDVAALLRSHEFKGQEGDDRFGSAALSWAF